MSLPFIKGSVRSRDSFDDTTEPGLHPEKGNHLSFSGPWTYHCDEGVSPRLSLREGSYCHLNAHSAGNAARTWGSCTGSGRNTRTDDTSLKIPTRVSVPSSELTATRSTSIIRQAFSRRTPMRAPFSGSTRPQRHIAPSIQAALRSAGTSSAGGSLSSTGRERGWDASYSGKP